MVLLAPHARVPKERSWKTARAFMGKVDDFLQALVSYDKEHIAESCLVVVKQEYLRNPEFHPDLVRTKSTAAAGLCAWAINIVYCEVASKRQALSQANSELESATAKLLTVRKKLESLTVQFETAADEKVQCQGEVTHRAGQPAGQGPGDDPAVAAWHNQGLPNDRMSTEDAAILTTGERWPLMIDTPAARHQVAPQALYLDVVERALACGETVLIENLQERVDPFLEPLLGRNTRDCSD
ncbi:unnamed protein product [Coregonus sp. 'balchen']|nr:unnamed protein product [Coregonus sp. 'balchen']